MKHLLERELKDRMLDLMNNIVDLTSDGKIGCLPLSGAGGYIFELFTELLEEICLRKYTWSAFHEDSFIQELPDRGFIKPTYPIRPRTSTVLQGCHLPQTPYLIKYGEFKYLKDLYTHGIIYINTASGFANDPNIARRDDEKEIQLNLPLYLFRDRLARSPYYSSSPLSTAKQDNLQVTISSDDYYLYCTSMNFTHRAADDFNADSCVIIKSIPKFLAQIRHAFSHVMPGYTNECRAIQYIDPILPVLRYSSQIRDKAFLKYIRYYYQREFRLIWRNKHTYCDLKPMLMNIGSISSYSTLVRF